ncbi:MAG: hypothetical protein ACO225_07250 [Ilumatobacteraceae bacterium]
MTPTLIGRLQTRLAVTVLVGGVWTLFVSVFLPGGGAGYGDRLATALGVLFTMLLLGLVWEFVYHWLMGFRWEKDWPSLLGLVTGLNEGIVLFVTIRAGGAPGVGSELGTDAFLIHFVTVWLVTWGWLQGPMKVVDPRWRFRGGRIW